MTSSDLAQLREFLARDQKPLDLAGEARRIGAVGVIVWAWDPLLNALRPSMSFGYSGKVLAELPNVDRNADNATAAAFRSGKMCTVAGVKGSTGALAAPIVSDLQYVGVLAVELPNGAERNVSTRAAVEAMAAKIRLEDRCEPPARRQG